MPSFSLYEKENEKEKQSEEAKNIMNNLQTTVQNQVPNINNNNIIIIFIFILSPINTVVKPRFSSPSLSSSVKNHISFLSVYVFKHHSGRKVLFWTVF